MESLPAVQFGVWYDFRQARPRTMDYSRFYWECLHEIELAEDLGFSRA